MSVGGHKGDSLQGSRLTPEFSPPGTASSRHPGLCAPPPTAASVRASEDTYQAVPHDSVVLQAVSARSPWPTDPLKSLWVCTNCGTGNATLKTGGVGAQFRCKKCGTAPILADEIPADEDDLRVEWTESAGVSRCQCCDETFAGSGIMGLRSGKHHCRDCGDVICDKCSAADRKRCAGYGQTLRRVCHPCYDVFLGQNVVLKVVAGSRGNSLHRSLVTLLDLWLAVEYSGYVTVLVDFHHDDQNPVQLSILAGSREELSEWSCSGDLPWTAVKRCLGEGIKVRMEQMSWRQAPAASFEACTLSTRLPVRVACSAPTELAGRQLLLLACILSELLRIEFGGAVDVVEPEEVEVVRCPTESCGNIVWWLIGEKPGPCRACGKTPVAEQATMMSWLTSFLSAQRDTYFFALQCGCDDGKFENMHPTFRDGLITEPEGFLQLRKELRSAVTRNLKRQAEEEACLKRERARADRIVQQHADSLRTMRDALIRFESSGRERLEEAQKSQRLYVEETRTAAQPKLCLICMEQPINVVLSCGHTFCARCVCAQYHLLLRRAAGYEHPTTGTHDEAKKLLQQFLPSWADCPSCRQPITSITRFYVAD